MEAIEDAMPRLAAKARARAGGGSGGSGAATGNGHAAAKEKIESFFDSMKAKRELDTSEGKVLWRGRRTGLLIDGTQVAKDADGFDNIASFFDSARIDDASAGASNTPSSVGFSTVSPGSAASSAWTAGRPPSSLGADEESQDEGNDRISNNNNTGAGAAAGGGDVDDGDDTETEDDGMGFGDGGSGGEEEDFGEEALRGRQLDYPPAKPTKKGAAAATAAVARSEVSTDEELAAVMMPSVPSGRRGAGRRRVDDDGDTETDGPLPEKQQQQQQQKENGAGPPRKGANQNGTKVSSPPSQTKETKGAASGGSGAPTPTPARTSSRRGKGGASPAAAAAAVTRSGRKERSKPQEGGESSSDDNAGGGDDWDPTDFGEGGDAGGDNGAVRERGRENQGKGKRKSRGAGKEAEGEQEGGGGGGGGVDDDQEMADFGGGGEAYDNGDEGMAPFSPDGDDGGGEEKARPSPVTRAAAGKSKKGGGGSGGGGGGGSGENSNESEGAKGATKKTNDEAPAAAATAAKKKKAKAKKAAGGDHHHHHRKGVVARLSVGRGKRSTAAAAAAAATTPGPPRREGGSRFVDISEVAEVSHTPGVRRSSRQRVAPLKFWRGDNIQYGVDEKGLQVAEGIVKGPALPEPSSPASRKRGGEGKKRGRPPTVKDEHMSPLSPSKVSEMRKNKKFKLMEKDQKCLVWDEETAAFKSRQVVMSSSNLVSHNVTATHQRAPGKEKIGQAAQAFLVAPEVGISEWLTGRLELPPGAIKDSEHVALSTQIYVVAEGQPNALEIAIAMPSKKTKRTTFDAKTAQRFLLSPGDHFYVPVNNVYRLENHSDRAKAVIYWTIIKAGGEGLSDNEAEA
ncbi:unnamed protein product [Ectocarpus fasciculatus]